MMIFILIFTLGLPCSRSYLTLLLLINPVPPLELQINQQQVSNKSNHVMCSHGHTRTYNPILQYIFVDLLLNKHPPSSVSDLIRCQPEGAILPVPVVFEPIHFQYVEVTRQRATQQPISTPLRLFLAIHRLSLIHI